MLIEKKWTSESVIKPRSDESFNTTDGMIQSFLHSNTQTFFVILPQIIDVYKILAFQPIMEEHLPRKFITLKVA